MTETFIATQRKFHAFLTTQSPLVAAVLSLFVQTVVAMTRDIATAVGVNALVVTLRYIADTVEDGQTFAEEQSGNTPEQIGAALDELTVAFQEEEADVVSC